MQAKNKTVATKTSVKTFLKTFPAADQKSIQDVINIFEKTTKKPCVLWGKIFGFGQYHYEYESGREGDFLATGFAVRKNNFTFYIMHGEYGYAELLQKLGKHSVKGSCIHVKSMNDISPTVLKKIITLGLKDLKKKWPVT